MRPLDQLNSKAFFITKTLSYFQLELELELSLDLDLESKKSQLLLETNTPKQSAPYFVNISIFIL